MQAGSHAFHSEFRQRTLKLPAHRKFLPAWNHNLSLSLPKEFRVPKGAPISNSRSLRGRLRNAAASSVWVFGGLKAVRAQAVTAWNFAERGHDFAVRGCHLSSRVKSTCKQIFGQRLPSRFANFAFRLTWFPELTASGSSSSAPLSTRSKPLPDPCLNAPPGRAFCRGRERLSRTLRLMAQFNLPRKASAGFRARNSSTSSGPFCRFAGA